MAHYNSPPQTHFIEPREVGLTFKLYDSPSRDVKIIETINLKC